MPEKISIMRDSGDTLSSNIVALFTLPDTQKQYIITTENAVDPHGLTVLHVSEVVDGVLKKVATDEEWTSIKTIMRSIISGNAGAYSFIPLITTAKAEAQYSRDISVSAAAAKQMTDSYTAALANLPAGGEEAQAPVVEDTNEITPGISEVAPEAPAAEAAPAEAPAAVGNAVTNIPADAVVTEPASAPEAPVAEVKEEAPAPAPVAEPEPAPATAPEAPEQPVAEPAPAAPVVSGSGQTPVVAYVDPAFQQLLTSDYNQILMHVQNINNNINQIAAMPALNYQPSYSANQNGAPNFNPNATVDEIIMGSTEVFNEGVKNLVATITEKLYRDLYEREAELTKREEMLLEREKMVNEQLSKLGSNNVQTEAPVKREEAPAVNVVQTQVKVEESKAENTVPAQQNTAPVAEPAPAKVEEKAEQPETPVGDAAPVNAVPQPVQTVEIV